MLNIVCVKTGTKYDADYVNKLQAMVQKNLENIEHRFICITDDTEGLNPDMYYLQALHDGWWAKMQVFDESQYIDSIFKDGEPILFLDLDTIIVKDIAELVVWGMIALESVDLVILEDFNRPDGYGSAVLMLYANSLLSVYANFVLDEDEIIKHYTGRNEGDQQYLEKVIPDVAFWPREWILSYKVDGLHTQPVPDTAKIVCFHGPPKNHEVDDGWVKRLWN